MFFCFCFLFFFSDKEMRKSAESSSYLHIASLKMRPLLETLVNLAETLSGFLLVPQPLNIH